MAYIYKITNIINNKIYIGATTKTVKDRFRSHIKDSKSNRCKHRPLYKAFNEYGIDNFNIEIIEECKNCERFDREIFWIDRLNTYNNGYNDTYGGEGKQKFNYDIILEELTYKRLTVKELSEKFKCSKDIIYQVAKENDINLKYSIDKYIKQKSKPVVRKDGEIITVFESIAEGAKTITGYKSSFNTKHTHISQCCKGERKTAYGYKWEFLD